MMTGSDNIERFANLKAMLFTEWMYLIIKADFNYGRQWEICMISFRYRLSFH